MPFKKNAATQKDIEVFVSPHRQPHPAPSSLGSSSDSEEDRLSLPDAAVAASCPKNNFLANISHEIRTPLGAILGFTEMMMIDPSLSADEREHYLAIVQRNARHLASLIDEMLDLSQLETGLLPLAKSKVCLRDLIESVAAPLRNEALCKGLEFKLSLGTSLPDAIVTDPARLRQVLMKVLGNAIKFTERGQVSLAVEVLGANSSEWTLGFLVKDTGIGISSEQAPHLFQPFTQADTSTTRRHGGTGTGLALSQRLVRALGGEITLENSDPHRGSTFQITLTTPVVESAPPPPANSPVDVPVPIAPRARILVVDDSSDNRLLISRILSKTGAAMDLVEDGCKAVEASDRQDYDLVVMDMQMPHMDGYQATRHLRQKGFTGPIVALTANALKNGREKCLEAGCSEYLTKPIDPFKLYSVIGQLLPH